MTEEEPWARNNRDVELRRGLAPAEVMRVYAAGGVRRGRNEPCTCGSGRKWKQCHWA